MADIWSNIRQLNRNFLPGPFSPKPFPPKPFPPKPTVPPEVDTSVLVEVFVVMSVLLYFMLGILLLAFGNRFLRATLFISGFSSIVVSIILLQKTNANNVAMLSFSSYQWSPVTAVMSITFGLAFGIINMMIKPVGRLVLGAQTGTLVVAYPFIVYEALTTPANPNEGWYWVRLFLTISGAVGAMATLYFQQKTVAIACTSIYGGAILTVCIDYFMQRCAIITWLLTLANKVTPIKPEGMWTWAALMVWVGLAAAGVLTQLLLCGSSDAQDEEHEQKDVCFAARSAMTGRKKYQANTFRMTDATSHIPRGSGYWSSGATNGSNSGGSGSSSANNRSSGEGNGSNSGGSGEGNGSSGDGNRSSGEGNGSSGATESTLVSALIHEPRHQRV